MERRVFCNGKLMLSLEPGPLKFEDIKKEIYDLTGIPSEEYYLIQNGKKLEYDEVVTSNIHCVFRTLGGKGGFGSMLRAIGAQIEKTTNREACRDLSGRRLRDINEEKRLKAWLDKQKDRETEAEEKRKKKIEKLVAVPKHEFKDAEYEHARSELTEKVSEAVEEGFKKASLKPTDTAALKRKATGVGNYNAKRAALWIGDDLNSSTDSDSDSDFGGESSTSKATVSTVKTKGDDTYGSVSADSCTLDDKIEAKDPSTSTSESSKSEDENCKSDTIKQDQ